jgi:hypothetical protein
MCQNMQIVNNILNYKDASGFFYMSALLFLNHARKPYLK